MARAYRGRAGVRRRQCNGPRAKPGWANSRAPSERSPRRPSPTAEGAARRSRAVMRRDEGATVARQRRPADARPLRRPVARALRFSSRLGGLALAQGGAGRGPRCCRRAVSEPGSVSQSRNPALSGRREGEDAGSGAAFGHRAVVHGSGPSAATGFFGAADSVRDGGRGWRTSLVPSPGRRHARPPRRNGSLPNGAACRRC